jgi:hypothetical protein
LALPLEVYVLAQALYDMHRVSLVDALVQTVMTEVVAAK